jgi:hypothetical protein
MGSLGAGGLGGVGLRQPIAKIPEIKKTNVLIFNFSLCAKEFQNFFNNLKFPLFQVVGYLQLEGEDLLIFLILFL